MALHEASASKKAIQRAVNKTIVASYHAANLTETRSFTINQSQNCLSSNSSCPSDFFYKGYEMTCKPIMSLAAGSFFLSLIFFASWNDAYAIPNEHSLRLFTNLNAPLLVNFIYLCLMQGLMLNPK